MKKFIPILFLLITFQLNAQIVGGSHVFNFLNAPSSPRITSLGGNLITVADDDVAQAFANPALTNPSMNGKIAFNYGFHLANIKDGYLGYGKYIKKWNASFHTGFQFINYKDFQGTDEIGNSTGVFKASEFAWVLGASKPIYDKLTLGANMKFISSSLEIYGSTGVSFDGAALYQDTAKRMTLTLLFKNMGTQLSSYNGVKESLPFEIQAGYSKRLAHLPFRYSIIYQYLNRWNITYDDPNEESAILNFGTEPQKDSPIKVFSNNLFRHFIFNGEFLLGKRENFKLRLGYNHFLHRNLSVKNFNSFAGFAFGFGFKTRWAKFDFGRQIYHLAGGVTNIGITLNLNDFRKK